MSEPARVSVLAFAAADPDDQSRGLLGWLTLEVDRLLRLDGLALRRTADGRLTLSFPARRDARGRERTTVRPLGQRERKEIERAVLAALRRQEVLQ